MLPLCLRQHLQQAFLLVLLACHRHTVRGKLPVHGLQDGWIEAQAREVGVPSDTLLVAFYKHFRNVEATLVLYGFVAPNAVAAAAPASA